MISHLRTRSSLRRMRLLTIAAIVCVIFARTAWSADATAGDGEPQSLQFEGYPDAPAFTIAEIKRVAAQRKRTRRRRCSRCHARMDPNPTIRELVDAPHLDGLSHGEGRIWCLVCHDEQDRDNLRTLLGEKVAFTQTYIVCGSCHASRAKDWHFGGHGKRLSNWRGERVIYDCTHCHDPHEPVIPARAPKPPPPVRAGLAKTRKYGRTTEQAWQHRLNNDKPAADD